MVVFRTLSEQKKPPMTCLRALYSQMFFFVCVCGFEDAVVHRIFKETCFLYPLRRPDSPDDWVYEMEGLRTGKKRRLGGGGGGVIKEREQINGEWTCSTNVFLGSVRFVFI